VEYANPISLSRPLHRAALGGSLETVTFLVKVLIRERYQNFAIGVHRFVVRIVEDVFRCLCKCFMVLKVIS
jgi:hypothetical protein